MRWEHFQTRSELTCDLLIFNVTIAKVPRHREVAAPEHFRRCRHFGSGRNLALRNVQLERCQLLLRANVGHFTYDLLVMAVLHVDADLRRRTNKCAKHDEISTRLFIIIFFSYGDVIPRADLAR